MASHISKQCASVFYHLHNISWIRRCLSTDTTKALVHAFVTSRIDFCNSLLYGLPASHLNKVQRILISEVGLVCRAACYCRITPLLYELHWLPVRQRISFKILLFVFKAIQRQRFQENLCQLKDPLWMVCCLQRQLIEVRVSKLRHFAMYYPVRFVLLQI